jgi:hypothetical protein
MITAEVVQSNETLSIVHWNSEHILQFLSLTRVMVCNAWCTTSHAARDVTIASEPLLPTRGMRHETQVRGQRQSYQEQLRQDHTQ